MPVLNTANALKVGTQAVSSVYCGTSQVFSSAFVPTQLTGLDLWLDASTLTGAAGAAVAAWPDKSGNARTVNIVGTPAFTIAPATKNGLRIVRFAMNAARARAIGLASNKDFTLVY